MTTASFSTYNPLQSIWIAFILSLWVVRSLVPSSVRPHSSLAAGGCAETKPKDPQRLHSLFGLHLSPLLLGCQDTKTLILKNRGHLYRIHFRSGTWCKVNKGNQETNSYRIFAHSAKYATRPLVFLGRVSKVLIRQIS